MPGLHHGNLCWGNRKSFYIYGEYPSSETLPTMDYRRNETITQPNTMYISTSGYYGYHHKVTNTYKNDNAMDTTEDISTNTDVRVHRPHSMACCKRQNNNEPNIEHIKRKRYQEGSESSENCHHKDGRTSHMSTYNLGFYMI